MTYFDGSNYYSVYLGASSPSGPFYHGEIDEVGLYNRALSPTEIQTIYNAGSLGRCGVSPAFIEEPVSQAPTLGNMAAFLSWAMGTWPLAYQWYKDGSAIAGATNCALLLFNVESNNVGDYIVIASNAVNIITSTKVYLTVNPPVCCQAPSGLMSWWQGEGNGLGRVRHQQCRSIECNLHQWRSGPGFQF